MLYTSLQTRFASSTAQVTKANSRAANLPTLDVHTIDSFEKRHGHPIRFSAYALSDKHKGTGDKFDPEKYPMVGTQQLRWKSLSKATFGLTKDESKAILDSFVKLTMVMAGLQGRENPNAYDDAENEQEALIKSIIDTATYPEDWEPPVEDEQKQQQKTR